MPTVYVLDVPENRPVVEVASRDDRVAVRAVGPYTRLSSSAPIVIDRRETGCRHAVWYSCLAGLAAGRVVQWDKNALRVEAS
ncbi:hypothetical protein Asp14428_18530 [Actinoplanes sp. NBRC 14428]|uniref:Uncharacterized protein n=1 Tax=Pseudosporangium ferrugineum TaxID=439699 RepID=A0A2T0SBL4_9ACTN|nr:hypothetical protein [Pseudosporangium ferrugineum]PRY30819.1 hypothetical protein CLV70_104371 [Pseudosporangium ferrugineum]BCJ50378.1 hypothetical protein Asp14428_18530 [Actinoplanes sp. NBRC 14428]